jgi:hypothetical protein
VRSCWTRWVWAGLALGGVLLPLNVAAEPATCADQLCRSGVRVPGSRVLPKDGPCGVGFYPSATYCISYARSRAVPKAGPRPVGFFPSARYCVAC